MRLRSLDVFRGVTMAGMVIVNNPGDWNAVYWPLLHAEWHGWTPTDLIFPFFLFILGAAIPLGSIEGRSWPRVWRRTAVIVGLGWFLAGFPFFRLATIRIPGVLVRIGLCYLAAASLVRLAGNDIRKLGRYAALAIAVLLVGYWFLMTLVPPPGGVAGDLSAEGNLGAWLDRTLLGGHLWREDWDPEGLLSTLPAIATTLLGVLAGVVLRQVSSPRVIVRRLAGWGLAGVLAGLAWHTLFPINKALWTSSYVLFTRRRRGRRPGRLLCVGRCLSNRRQPPYIRALGGAREKRAVAVRGLGVAGEDVHLPEVAGSGAIAGRVALRGRVRSVRAAQDRLTRVRGDPPGRLVGPALGATSTAVVLDGLNTGARVHGCEGARGARVR